MLTKLIFVALIGVALSIPIEQVQIVKLTNDVQPDGSYVYSYESEDGKEQTETGELKTVGDKDVVVVKGSYSYIGPDEIEYVVSYVADELGFRPVGEHIPKTPDLILQSLEHNAKYGTKDDN